MFTCVLFKNENILVTNQVVNLYIIYNITAPMVLKLKREKSIHSTLKQVLDKFGQTKLHGNSPAASGLTLKILISPQRVFVKNYFTDQG